MVTREFWKDRKVLITGHTGFKGSWLSLWLKLMGADVTGYSLPAPTTPSLFDSIRISSEIKSHVGDIRDARQLESVCSLHSPEVIIHMAAQSLVPLSYVAPLETYSVNIMGTANLLEAARKTGTARVIIVVTSDKCYENREWLWGYREDDPLGGHDPYSTSKGCAELITAGYRKSFFSGERPGAALASVRAGNVVGGGDWAADRLVPDVIRALLEGRPVVIRSPQGIRPWQFVLEPLHGYLSLAEHLWQDGAKFSGAWNFGPPDDNARPVATLVSALQNLWEGRNSWELDAREHPHEARYLKLDSTKARALLGWRTTLDLDTTLRWVAGWYRAFSGKKDMRRFSEAQIEEFEALCNADADDFQRTLKRQRSGMRNAAGDPTSPQKVPIT